MLFIPPINQLFLYFSEGVDRLLAGIYICEAFNKHGSTSNNLNIKVSKNILLIWYF